MIQFVGNRCTGCRVCKISCPVSCITMIEDACGFAYPRVDEKSCIKCGRCVSSCHSLASSQSSDSGIEPQVFAAQSKAEGDLRDSSSGGYFSIVAKHILNQGGVVYGAAWRGFSARHIRATDEVQLHAIRGSKYVESRIDQVMPTLIEDAGSRPVLFSGTPCQVAAAKAYVGPALSKQILFVDLVCHGVPSETLFLDYIAWLKTRMPSLCGYSSRDKSVNGWSCRGAYYIFEKNEIVAKPHRASDPYSILFDQALLLREACYMCPYAKRERMGDLTLGDYWGVESVSTSFDQDKGVSLICVNSIRGEHIFSACANEVRLVGTEFVLAAKKNANLESPTSMPKARAHYLSLYQHQGFPGLARQLRRDYWHKIALIKIKKAMPLSLKRRLKKLAVSKGRTNLRDT